MVAMFGWTGTLVPMFSLLTTAIVVYSAVVLVAAVYRLKVYVWSGEWWEPSSGLRDGAELPAQPSENITKLQAMLKGGQVGGA